MADKKSKTENEFTDFTAVDATDTVDAEPVDAAAADESTVEAVEVDADGSTVDEPTDGAIDEKVDPELQRLIDDYHARKEARRPKPEAPSFGISEGTRQEIEMHGKAVDPFTGKILTRDDLNK